MFTAMLLSGLAATVSAGIIAPRAASAREVQCPIVFDGRIPTDTTLSDFDKSSSSPFNPDYVKGNDIEWSDILLFPTSISGSEFDGDEFQPVEVTLSDDSVFQEQFGFRRAGLLFKEDAGDSPLGNAGVKTIHFSISIDQSKPLNLSHEYLAVWHEAADYSSNQFNFELGAILGQSSLPADTFKVLNRSNKQIWSTPIDEEAWNNFAIVVDYDEDTLTVYYSQDDAELEMVAGPVTNDNSGEGQFQVGMLKKPTGTEDVVNEGYQESGLDEGLIYSGVFVEDGADGCLSL